MTNDVWAATDAPMTDRQLAVPKLVATGIALAFAVIGLIMGGIGLVGLFAQRPVIDLAKTAMPPHQADAYQALLDAQAPFSYLSYCTVPLGLLLSIATIAVAIYAFARSESVPLAWLALVTCVWDVVLEAILPVAMTVLTWPQMQAYVEASATTAAPGARDIALVSGIIGVLCAVGWTLIKAGFWGWAFTALRK